MKSASPQATEEIGYRIGRALRPGAVLSLEGPLGSGKTVLVQGIARALGIEEPVTSPTFTLVSRYRAEPADRQDAGFASARGVFAHAGAELIHVDLYRIEAEEEAEELGLEEMMAGDGIVVVEWGEKAAGLLPADAARVRLSIGGPDEREIRIEGLEL